MKTINEIKEQLTKYKEDLERNFHVRKIGLFGSYVKEEQGLESDLDVLIEFKKSVGLLKFIELENYLSEITGTKVDLVMKNALKPRIGRRILEKVINI